MTSISPYNAWPNQIERKQYNIFKHKFRQKHNFKRNKQYYRLMHAAYKAQTQGATLDQFSIHTPVLENSLASLSAHP